MQMSLSARGAGGSFPVAGCDFGGQRGSGDRAPERGV